MVAHAGFECTTSLRLHLERVRHEDVPGIVLQLRFGEVLRERHHRTVAPRLPFPSEQNDGNIMRHVFCTNVPYQPDSGVLSEADLMEKFHLEVRLFIKGYRRANRSV